jgi:hypothetical protein
MMYHGSPYHPKDGSTQKVAYTASAGTITNAVGGGTECIRVVVTSNAYIKIGSSPTATTSDVYMPANVPEYFLVKGANKVSAIQDAVGGNLIVTEMVK